MSSKPIAFNFGNVLAPESILFHEGDPQKFRQIGCFAYLLQMEAENILVDTGINHLSVVNQTKRGPHSWQRKADETIESQLAKHHLSTEDISTVILTHMHYDHCSNAIKFSHARFILCASEWEYVNSAAYQNTERYAAIKGVIDFLAPKVNHGLELITEDKELSCGIKICLAGGHTPGSMMVEASYPEGEYLMTGDTVFLNENVQKQKPIGFTADIQKSKQVLHRLCGYPGTILTGHDPLAF